MFNNNESLTVFINGESYSVRREDNKNFDEIVNCLLAKEYDDILSLINVKKTIEETGDGRVTVHGSTVYYDGKPLHNALADKIVDMAEAGLPVSNLIQFLENLMENPSNTAINELYLFLESGSLPVTEDGHFLAYKKVRENYRDIHSGRFDNSVGAVVEMERRDVDDNRERTCSHGLHFCSKDYLPSFGGWTGSRVMILKIHPKDVVSIPSDYANTKGRCSRYEVIGEWEDAGDLNYTRDAFDRPYYSNRDLYRTYGYDNSGSFTGSIVADEETDFVSDFDIELIDWAETMGLMPCGSDDPAIITNVEYEIDSVSGETVAARVIVEGDTEVHEIDDHFEIEVLRDYLREQVSVYNRRAKLTIKQVGS